MLSSNRLVSEITCQRNVLSQRNVHDAFDLTEKPTSRNRQAKIAREFLIVYLSIEDVEPSSWFHKRLSTWRPETSRRQSSRPGDEEVDDEYQ